MSNNIFSSNIGKTASFRVFPNIIKDDFTDVKILSVLNYEAASGYNLAEMHARVYPTLPAGVPNDYRAYDYLMIRFPNEKIDVIGIPWIDETSVAIHSTTDINVTIRGKGVSDIPLLRTILAANGFLDTDIKTTSR